MKLLSQLIEKRMARSWIENVVGEYYRKLGYFVIENFTYFSQTPDKRIPGWQEIDVLATKVDELKIVSCKRGLTPSGYRRLPMYFKMHVNALGKSPYSWLLQKSKGRIENVLVIEYPRKEHVKMIERKVKVVPLKQILLEYVFLLERELTANGGREGMESNFVTRTVKALIEYGIIPSIAP